MTVLKVKETWVKKKVVDFLKLKGIYYFFPVAGGFMQNGVPDIICCVKGKFIGIECKAGKNKTTAIQDKNIRSIQASGGIAMVINEDNLEYMMEIINEALL
jgi:Holliday junction resolvase